MSRRMAGNWLAYAAASASAAAGGRGHPCDEAEQARTAWRHRQVHHPRHGAQPRRADQDSQRARVAVECFACEPGHQRDVGPDGDADGGEQQQGAARGKEAEGVTRPCHELTPPVVLAGRMPARRHAHLRERREHYQIAHHIQAEAPALAERRDERAADERADEARAVHHHGIERDGVGQVAFAADQLEQDRLARAGIECVHDAEDQVSGDEMPGRGDAERYDEEHRSRLRGGNPVGRHQYPAPVQPVDENPGQRGEDEKRDLQGECRKAQKERRARQVVHQPAGGDHLQPAADLRDALADEEQAEVAEAQGPQALRETHVRAASLSSWALTLASVASKPASRSRSCATTFAGARSTEEAFPRFPRALVISPSRRAASFFRRSRSASGSTSICSMSRELPTTATGESDSGRTLTCRRSLSRAKEETAAAVAWESDVAGGSATTSATRSFGGTFASLLRLRAALVSSLRTAMSRSAAGSILSGCDFG